MNRYVNRAEHLLMKRFFQALSYCVTRRNTQIGVNKNMKVKKHFTPNRTCSKFVPLTYLLVG